MNAITLAKVDRSVVYVYAESEERSPDKPLAVRTKLGARLGMILFATPPSAQSIMDKRRTSEVSSAVQTVAGAVSIGTDVTGLRFPAPRSSNKEASAS